MLRSLLSVGGFTLLSRAVGFVRDILMASVLGRGLLSDAFVIAFRLPNHFRAIFAEGAYNAAFIPLYASLRQQGGEAARTFARTMLGWQIAIQLVFLIAALIFMPWVVAALAPGFTERPEQMALAVDLTRITFAYLLSLAVVTHLGDTLNAEKTFWPAAAAPVLLNLCMIAALSAAVFFPTAAHAAAWGVFAGGFAELLLLVVATARNGLPVLPLWPKATTDVRKFASRFGPAALGAGGVQIALFADTILVSFLAVGEPTSLYYADRVNQLPIGVIGVALGTVLLPELSRALAAGDEAKATHSFNRATEIGLLLTLPCLVMFLAAPDAIMRGLFARGAFDVQAAEAAAGVLMAYAIGLPAFVLLRTVTPLFHARADTTTPVIATAIAIAINLAVKFALVFGFGLGAAGLALGTSVGSWVNIAVLAFVAAGRGLLTFDKRLTDLAPRIVVAAVYATGVVWLISQPLADALASITFLRAELYLVIVGLAALTSYGVMLLGLGWKR
ncbi:MAG: murein biosynthesis integral membrane protein MurJ [Micropepsaceae bacterium]